MLKVVKAHESELADVITNDQLFRGLNADGEKIFPEYTEVTKAIKQFKNQPFDRVTLLDEGDLYRSVFVDTRSFPVHGDARDPKKKELEFKYGDNLFDIGSSANTDEILEEDIIKMFENGLEEALRNL